MLYVFLVDTGTMLRFDMNLALDDVAVLKRTIASIHSIPEDQQVLLCSGGTSLDPSMKVCNYGSGTDTCPISLFSKCSIDSDTPPRPTICGSITEANMEENVDACLKMPNTYQSLVVRVQLAQQFAELATNEKKICERLVRDQRLQQQGWATVIANLEDSTHAFTQQAAYVEEMFLQYLKSRPAYQAVLQKEFCARFRNEETILFVLRVMVGLIILYDHVHPVGAFAKSAHIDVKGSIKVLKDQPPNVVEGLLNALRYTTRHLNDETTPKHIKSLLA